MARLTVNDPSRHHDNRRVIANIAGQFRLRPVCCPNIHLE
jgi:hypothetical protein